MIIKTQYLKMEILSRLMYKFYATLIKIPTEFPCREINMILKFRLRNKGPVKNSQDNSEELRKGDEVLPCQILIFINKP